MASDKKIFGAVAVSEYRFYRRASIAASRLCEREITDKTCGPSSQLHWIMTLEARNHTIFFLLALHVRMSGAGEKIFVRSLASDVIIQLRPRMADGSGILNKTNCKLTPKCFSEIARALRLYALAMVSMFLKMSE